MCVVPLIQEEEEEEEGISTTQPYTVSDTGFAIYEYYLIHYFRTIIIVTYLMVCGFSNPSWNSGGLKSAAT